MTKPTEMEAMKRGARSVLHRIRNEVDTGWEPACSDEFGDLDEWYHAILWVTSLINEEIEHNAAHPRAAR